MLNNKSFIMRRINKIITLILVGTYVSSNCVFGATPLETPSKRYIFVDGGAFNGRVYKTFHTISSYSKYSWEIFAIEANPYVIDQLPQIPNLTILSKAIWIDNGSIEFYVDMTPNRYNVSSLFEHNPDKPRKVIVESFDFSQWLKKNFTINDYIIVNFDIEGAEYSVLEKMVADKTIQYIDKLYVEFHPELFGELVPKVKKINFGEKGNEFCEEVDEKAAKFIKELKEAGAIVHCASLWDILLRDIIGEIKWSDFLE